MSAQHPSVGYYSRCRRHGYAYVGDALEVQDRLGWYWEVYFYDGQSVRGAIARFKSEQWARKFLNAMEPPA